MNLDLTEDLALPDGTRVFRVAAPTAGVLTALSIPGFTSGFTLVTSVAVGGAEKLGHPYQVPALEAAIQNGSVVLGSIARDEELVVHLVGDADGVSASLS